MSQLLSFLRPGCVVVISQLLMVLAGHVGHLAIQNEQLIYMMTYNNIILMFNGKMGHKGPR